MVFRRQVVIGVLVVSIAMAGCTKTVVHRVAPYRPGQEPITGAAPEVSHYKVKVFDRDGKLLHGIDGTDRWAARGQPMGFRTDENGVVFAVAGGESFPLPPTDDRSVVWVTKYERQTQFGKEVHKALETTGAIIVGAGALALLGFAVGLGLAAGADDDESTW